MTYLAETKYCIPVFDQQHLISRLKSQVQLYPAPLQHKLINNSLWQVEFTLLHAHRFAAQGDIFNSAGCLARIAFFLLQALFALNGEYYFGDKGAVEASGRFGKQPTQFPTRLESALSSPLAELPQLESAVRILEDLWHEVVNLTGGKLHTKIRPPVVTYASCVYLLQAGSLCYFVAPMSPGPYYSYTLFLCCFFARSCALSGREVRSSG